MSLKCCRRIDTSDQASILLKKRGQISILEHHEFRDKDFKNEGPKQDDDEPYFSLCHMESYILHRAHLFSLC